MFPGKILFTLLLACLLTGANPTLAQDSGASPQTSWKPVDLPRGEYCFALTFDPANPQRALLGTRPGSLWESLDGGVQWTRKKTAIESTREHGVNAGGIAYHPRVPGLWYFGHEKFGAFRSRDNGETWTLINKGLEYYSERHGICFAFDAKDDNVIYYGADGGLFKSTDFGDHWTKCTKGLPTGMADGKRGNTTVSRFVVHPRTGAICAGFYACGRERSPGCTAHSTREKRGSASTTIFRRRRPGSIRGPRPEAEGASGRQGQRSLEFSVRTGSEGRALRSASS